MSLIRLLAQFLYIGSTAFGGPLALIGVMEDRLVQRRKIVSSDEFAEGVALGQMLPGPVAVDAAAYVGYRVRGLWGAVISTFGIVLPAFLLMLILTPLYLQYGKVPRVEGFFSGTRAAVIAVIIGVCWRMGKKSATSRPTYLIILIVFALTAFCRMQPLADVIGPGFPVEAVLIVLSAALGVILCKPGSKES